MESFTAMQRLEAELAFNLFQSIHHRNRAYQMSLYPARYSKEQVREQLMLARESAAYSYRLAWRRHGRGRPFPPFMPVPLNDEEK